MATVYYVKPAASGGNDLAAGTSEATAWATITKAKNTMNTAGDIVHIAPGTYRESVVLSFAGSAGAGNEITYAGDPNCQYFTGIKPGYVRITGCDVNEYPSLNANIFDFNAKAYVTLQDVVVDGALTLGRYAISGPTTSKCIRVIAMGKYAIGGCTCEDCVASAGYYGFTNSITDRCLAVGGSHGYYQGTSINSLVVGASLGFRGAAATNCTAIGSGSAFYATGAVVAVYSNCLAFQCYYGFDGQASNLTIANCVSAGCQAGAYGRSNASLLDVSTLYYVNCYYEAYPPANITGVPIAAKHIGWVDNIKMIEKVAAALKPTLVFETGIGTDALLPSSAMDAIGNPRRLGDGIIDIGAIAYSNKVAEWTTYKSVMPAIRINRAGVEVIQFTTKSGVPRTVRVWVKFDLQGGADYPKLILSGNGIATQTDTASGDGSSDWELLTVTATPSCDTIAKVQLYSVETNANSYTIFSDVGIM